MRPYDAVVNQWKAWNVKASAELNFRLHSFRILFAYHSGKIENEDVTFDATKAFFENGRVIACTGSPLALIEQQNQKIYYEFLLGKIIAKEPLSIFLIREIHRVLTEGTYDAHRYVERGERPGEFKKHDYVTGVNEVGAQPDEVEGDLSELIDEVNAIGQKTPLKAGAYFHARFEHIHPLPMAMGVWAARC